MSGLDILAILTGAGAIITAIGGILLAIRSVRSRERKAAEGEIAEVSQMLQTERTQRLAAEQEIFRLRLLLTRNGIEEESDA